MSDRLCPLKKSRKFRWAKLRAIERSAINPSCSCERRGIITAPPAFMIAELPGGEPVRQILITVLALVLANSAAAAEKLTPQEIADGWIMLFDGESTFGWSVEGKAEVEDGILTLGGGDKPRVLTTKGIFGRAEIRWSFRQDG